MSRKLTKLSPYKQLRGAPINKTTIDFPKSPVYNEENPTYNLAPTSPTSKITDVTTQQQLQLQQLQQQAIEQQQLQLQQQAMQQQQRQNKGTKRSQLGFYESTLYPKQDILSPKKKTLIVIVNPKYGNIKSKKDIPNLGAPIERSGSFPNLGIF
ncbi:hypothetical protein C2G38_2040735 [Gigaspora rosea]|uniref:Uncharacterized protein n=1 Tax=Gigaspora rosea TaxID=44941 RepID=A0A397UU03_9GLOM|nr:hypothetical protein C2G38_2040735 [Gigaspora rosea]